MTSLVHDVRYAVREAVRRPAFTTLALLTLGLGIGAVTMMYSVIYSVLLNPFPYTDPRRMVDVIIQDAGNADRGIRGALAIPEFRAFVDESEIFEEATGAWLTSMIYRTGQGPEQFQVAALTPNSFHFLGVSALIGRTIGPDDVKAGAPPVAVLSYKAWIAYFGRDPAVVGRSIVLDDWPMTVIGVMPPRFTWHVADVWIPDAASADDPDAMKKGFWLQGRLRSGLSMTTAEARLNVIGRRLAELYPDRYPKNFTVKVLTIIDWVVGKFRRVLYTLFGAVGLLLLIACSNVANMLLARATSREKELAIRAALGATRLRIVRQLLIESLLLALGGGVIGIVLAYAGTRVLTGFIPPYTIPVETEIGINGFVLLFSIGAAAGTALLFGAIPALQATGRDVAPGLAASGKGSDIGGRRGGLRNVLVVVEVALSLVLLAGAGALMRNFLGMLTLDLGFNPRNIIVARMSLPDVFKAQRRQIFEAALPRIAALPGVVSAGVTSGLPAPFGGLGTDIDTPGSSHRERWTGQVRLCNDTYFQTVGLRLLSGSALSRNDIAVGRKVAVVNETLAKKYFSGQDPIGKQLRLERLSAIPGGVPDPQFEIVGVVADTRNQGLELFSAPEALVPFTTVPAAFPSIVVRTSSDARTMANALRREIHAANPNLIQRDPMTLDEMLRDFAYARPRFSMLLMSVFAAIGLVLVGTGVYGVMAYTVSSRTREIGIRVALGAGRGQVLRSVFGRTFRMLIAGGVAGALASVATHRLLSAQVWNVGKFDAIALAGAVSLVLLLGIAACLVPAVRATEVQPTEALRHE